MKQITQEKAGMLFSSAEIFIKAEYMYSTPDYDGNPDIYRWNYFYVPIDTKDGAVGIRIAVRDVQQTARGLKESQIYSWGIKKDTPLDGGSPGVSAASTGASSGASDVTVSQTTEKSQGETVGSDGTVMTNADAHQNAKPDAPASAIIASLQNGAAAGGGDEA